MRNVRKFLTAMAVAAVLLPGSLAAQDVLIGVKGGINSANVSLDPDVLDTSSRTGFVGGLFAEFGISELFAIRPEALYSSKGFEAMAEDQSAELELAYIEIPVLLVARFGSSSVRPVVFAGPVIGFESSCEASESEFDEDVACSDLDDPIDTKSTDFGAAFGAGVEIDLGGFFLLGDARYSFGFTNLLDSAIDGVEVSAKNQGWSFQAGLGIGVG